MLRNQISVINKEILNNNIHPISPSHPHFFHHLLLPITHTCVFLYKKKFYTKKVYKNWSKSFLLCLCVYMYVYGVCGAYVCVCIYQWLWFSLSPVLKITGMNDMIDISFLWGWFSWVPLPLMLAMHKKIKRRGKRIFYPVLLLHFSKHPIFLHTVLHVRKQTFGSW